MFFPFYDSTYILVLIGVIVSMMASAKLNATYQRYSAVRSMCGLTGAEAAKRLLNSQGIYDVTIRRVPGSLTDHYDPRSTCRMRYMAPRPLPPSALLPMSAATPCRMRRTIRP